MNLIRRLIRCNGTSQDLAAPVTLEQVLELIGAQVVSPVALRHLGLPLHVMIVDDQGYETKAVEHTDGHLILKPVRARKPLNQEATRLYLANCRPDTEHQIVGDVVVAPDEDFA